MKKIIFTLAALACAMVGRAQISDGVTATLINGETTQVFYGFDAFKVALDSAAQTGCSIVLSPGTFSNPGNITKSVKVYGAGFQPDEANGLSETRVIGDIKIYITSADAPLPNDVRLEGIYSTGSIYLTGYRNHSETISGTEIVKCRFSNFYNQSASANTIIRQSYFTERINGEYYMTTDMIIANCIFSYPVGFANGSSVLVEHCIMFESYYSYGPYLYMGNIIHPQNGYAFAAGATCYYNVGSQVKFANGVNNVCVGNYDQAEWGSFAQLFADGQDNLDYADADGNPRTWVLAEPTKYVDAEGSPCGVTGGNYPWNPTPTLPRILSTSVDSKTTPGKLKVTLKAEARPLE